MKINFNTVNFLGYKNLIHTDMRSYNNNRLTLMTLQLDDLDGHNDLAYFKKILAENEMPPTDVMTLLYLKKDNVRGRFYLNNEPLLLSDELKLLENPVISERYSVSERQNVKSFNVKSCTLIASLTKRLMNSGSVANDGEMKHTIEEVRNMLINAFPSPKYMMEIFLSAFNEKKPYQETALEFNKRVDHIMKRFLEAR